MIQINLLRISPDSKYLEFSVECPTGYVFNQLSIWRYILNGEYDTLIDASALLMSATQKEVIRIDTGALGSVDNGSAVTMYKVEFGVTAIDEGSPEIENIIGICSNVNFVYENLLDLILKINKGCISCTEYDLLSRNYMFLYAHIEAMRLERFEEAEKFYDIIYNLFTNCGPTSRSNTTYTKSCGCQ